MGYTNYLTRPEKIDGYAFNCFLADAATLVAAWFDYCTGKNRSLTITDEEVVEAVGEGLLVKDLFRLNEEPDITPEGLWDMLIILEHKGDFRTKGANLACHFVRQKKLHLGFPTTSSSEDVYISPELHEWDNQNMIFCKTNRDQPFDMLVAALFALAEEKTRGAFKFSSDDVFQQKAGWELLRAVFGSRRFPARPAFKVRNVNHLEWAASVFLDLLDEMPDQKIDAMIPLIFERLNERFEMKRVSQKSLKTALVNRLEEYYCKDYYIRALR